MNPTQALPAHARQDPPWTDCGDPRAPDFGRVFARKVAGDAVALTFDRSGRRHALTLSDISTLGGEIVIYGRRFSVVFAAERGR
jgi:hypothetical protein